MRRGLLRAEVRRADVHVEKLVVLGFGQGGWIAGLRHSGVVHEHVEAAELRRGLVDNTPAVSDPRKVPAQDHRAAARRGDLHTDIARALAAVRVMDRDRRALQRELARDALADAGPGPGH